MLKGLKNAFAKLFTAVKALFTPEGQKKAAEALGQAESLVATALPIVEAIAQMTPTKADDEVIAVVKSFLGTVPAGPLTDEQKGGLLFDSAASALKKAVVTKANVPDSVIDLAIQLAYTAFRATTR